MRRFLTILSGQGRVLVLIFLSLGFAQIPGIAVVLGLFMVYLGIRIAMGRSGVWVPKFLRRRKMSSYFLKKVIRQTLRMLKFVKRWSWPRYQWATQQSTTRVANGCMIAIVGLCLAVSPPIPLTGLLGSAAIFLIGIGLLNEDGVYIVLGYVATLLYLTTVLLLLNYFSITEVFGWVRNTIRALWM